MQCHADRNISAKCLLSIKATEALKASKWIRLLLNLFSTVRRVHIICNLSVFEVESWGDNFRTGRKMVGSAYYFGVIKICSLNLYICYFTNVYHQVQAWLICRCVIWKYLAWKSIIYFFVCFPKQNWHRHSVIALYW